MLAAAPDVCVGVGVSDVDAHRHSDPARAVVGDPCLKVNPTTGDGGAGSGRGGDVWQGLLGGGVQVSPRGHRVATCAAVDGDVPLGDVGGGLIGQRELGVDLGDLEVAAPSLLSADGSDPARLLGAGVEVDRDARVDVPCDHAAEGQREDHASCFMGSGAGVSLGLCVDALRSVLGVAQDPASEHLGAGAKVDEDAPTRLLWALDAVQSDDLPAPAAADVVARLDAAPLEGLDDLLCVVPMLLHGMLSGDGARSAMR